MDASAKLAKPCSLSARLRRFLKPAAVRLLAGGLLALSVTGCTTLGEYIHNGFKVGPNYKRPPAAVAEAWIDATDKRVRSDEPDDSHWWTAFNDPMLDQLVQFAYGQNLTLREAGFRVLTQRAQLGIAIGFLFPQDQQMNGDFNQRNLSGNVANRFGTPQLNYSQWDYGFGMAWELDFWGRFRRAVEAQRDELDASVENYDDVLVSLISDVASNYVIIRTLQQRIAYAKENIRLQNISLRIATARFKGGQSSEMDANQAQSDVSATEALIPELEIQMRNASNRLCVLLGIPPEELVKKLGPAPIPTAPPELAVGIPADLLRRRPDVRKAERQAAAECAKIGIAVSELYPHIQIAGSLGWSAQNFADLFSDGSFRGVVGPAFSWDILNYFRHLNAIRAQDARFQAAVAKYQETVLKANEEAENGLVKYLKAHQRVRFLTQSVNAEQKALKEALAQYEGGMIDFNRVAVVQEKLVERQELLAEAQGEIALGMVQVYKAIGGGWQIRCGPVPPQTILPLVEVKPGKAGAGKDEMLPAPKAGNGKMGS